MKAVVLGASGGIGAALVEQLRDRGTATDALFRRDAGAVERSARVDITDEASVAAAAAACAADGVDIRLVLVATGVLQDERTGPEKTMRTLDADRLAHVFAVNAIGPALVAKHFLPLLPRRGRSVFAVLSARVGSIADNRLGGWYGYRASKAALNQIVHTLGVELARTHPEAIVAALHPGTVATTLSAPHRAAEASGVFDPATAAIHLLRVVEGLTPGDSGGFFAWDGTAIPF